MQPMQLAVNSLGGTVLADCIHSHSCSGGELGWIAVRGGCSCHLWQDIVGRPDHSCHALQVAIACIKRRGCWHYGGGPRVRFIL